MKEMILRLCFVLVFLTPIAFLLMALNVPAHISFSAGVVSGGICIGIQSWLFKPE